MKKFIVCEIIRAIGWIITLYFGIFELFIQPLSMLISKETSVLECLIKIFFMPSVVLLLITIFKNVESYINKHMK